MPAVIYNATVKVTADAAGAKAEIKALGDEAQKVEAKSPQKLGSTLDRIEASARSANQQFTQSKDRLDLLGRIGSGSLQSIDREVLRLVQHFPLVGQPLSHIMRQLFAARDGFNKFSQDGERAGAATVKAVERQAAALDTLMQRAAAVRQRVAQAQQDFNEGLKIQYGGRIETGFLKNFRVADHEKRAEMIAGAGLSSDFTKQVERSALQFEKLERNGTQALDAIDAKVAQGTASLAEMGGETEVVGGGFAALAGPLGIALALILSLVVAVGAAGLGLYKLAESTAATADKYHDLSLEVNLSAHELSALDVGAAQVGVKFDQVGSALGIFDKKLEGAAEKSSKLGRVLKANGVDVTDNQKALEGLFTILARLPEGQVQTALAMEAFGKGGKNMLAIVKQAHGDLPGFIRLLDQMGATISDKDAAAAHEFDAKLEVLKHQFDAAKVKVGEELLPVFMQLFDNLSSWISRNQQELRDWGHTFKDVALVIIEAAKDIKRQFDETLSGWRTLQSLTPSAANDPHQTSMSRSANGLWQWTQDQLAQGSAYIPGNGDPYSQPGPNAWEQATGHAPSRMVSPQEAEAMGAQARNTRGLLSALDQLDSQVNAITTKIQDGEAARVSKLMGESGKEKKEHYKPDDFTSKMLGDGLGVPTPGDPNLRMMIEAYAAMFGIPLWLAFAQIYKESNFKIRPVHHDGVFGLTQMKPDTASAALGRHVTGEQLEKDPKLALTGWGAEMTRLFHKYGSWELALFGYHNGEGAADKIYALLEGAKSGAIKKQVAEKGIESLLAQQPKGTRYMRDIMEYEKSGHSIQESAKDYINIGGAYQTNPITGLPDMTKPTEGGQAVELTPTKLLGFRERIAAMLAAQRNHPLNAGESSLADTSMLGFEQTPSQKGVSDYYTNLIKKEEETAGRRVFLAEYVAGRRREIAAEYYDRETSMMVELGGKEQELAELRRQAADGQVSEQRRLLAAKSEEVDLTQRLISLQDEYANSGANEALRKQVATLEERVAIRREDVQAVEDQARAQVRLADQTVYHAGKADAAVLQFMASQKGVTDIFSDAKIGVIKKTYDGIDAALDRIVPKLNGFGSILKQIISDLLKLAADKFFMRLFGLDKGASAETGGGGRGGSQGGGGFNIGSLLNLGGGGGNGGGGGRGGLFGFGNIIQNFKDNGFVGGLKNMIGLGSAATTAAAAAVPTGAAAAGAGGLAAGMGALSGMGVGAAAGGAVGAGALGMGASSASAAGASGGMFSGLMPLLTNPWTAVAAGAIVGGLLLFKHFSHGTEKKLQDAIKSAYQVDMKNDWKTLGEIKAIGEQIYGKGQVSKHIQEVIMLDQVKQIVEQYAVANNINSSLVANQQLKDAANSANNFTRRAWGGPVEAGVPYIVGDRGPQQYWEVFVPPVDGEIVPSLGQYADRARARVARGTVSAAPPARGASSSSGDGGIPRSMFAAMIAAMARVHEVMDDFEATDDSATFKRMVKKHARDVADSVNSSLSRGYRKPQIQRNLNLA
jgi:hypothetical protein